MCIRDRYWTYVKKAIKEYKRRDLFQIKMCIRDRLYTVINKTLKFMFTTFTFLIPLNLYNAQISDSVTKKILSL